MPPIFGYGSLILPTSLISRFEAVDPALEEVYQGNTDQHIRGDALKKWKCRRDRITYVPAKVFGFRRYYSYKSSRGNTMLDVVHTKDPEDWINGVLIFGLTEDEEERIAQSEAGYELLTLSNSEIEYYVDLEEFEDSITSETDEFDIYVSPQEEGEVTARKPRNKTYHSRIVAGIMMIGEMYGTEIGREFYEDFCVSTYETAYDSSDPFVFNTIQENNGLGRDQHGKFHGDL